MTTDNPPFWPNVKNTRGVICSEFEKKNTRGDPYYFLEKYLKDEKITRGDPYYFLEKHIKGEKITRGDPYYEFSKFESFEKKK